MALLIDLTPLRASPSFRRLWWGLGVSNIGTQLTAVAVGLQVYAITRSTLSVGILGIFALVPLVVLGLYGGALVDAYDRRRIALLASVGLWLVSIGLAVQAWLHVDSVWLPLVRCRSGAGCLRPDGTRDPLQAVFIVVVPAVPAGDLVPGMEEEWWARRRLRSSAGWAPSRCWLIGLLARDSSPTTARSEL
jgi:MFS family permease